MSERPKVRGSVPARHRLVQCRAEIGRHGVPDGSDQCRAIGYVLVQGRPTYTDPLGDRGHDDAIEALLLEEGAGGGDDGLAGGAGWGGHVGSIGY